MLQAPPVDAVHMVPKRGLRNRYTTLTTTYSCPLPLPKGGNPTHLPPLVCVIDDSPANEAGASYYGLGIYQVLVQS